MDWLIDTTGAAELRLSAHNRTATTVLVELGEPGTHTQRAILAPGWTETFRPWFGLSTGIRTASLHVRIRPWYPGDTVPAGAESTVHVERIPWEGAR